MSAAVLTCRGDGTTDVTTCIEQAFAAGARTGDRTLQIPAGTYIVSHTITVPDKFALQGDGRGDPGFAGTTIRASRTFPIGAKLIDMGQYSPSFRVQITQLTADCSGRAAVGIYNSHAEEQSHVEHVLIQHCTSDGLRVEGSGAQNSGPYQDIEVLPTAGGSDGITTATHCISVHNVVGFRGIRGATCNGGSFTPDVAVDIDGSGSYDGLHVEHFWTAMQIGAYYPADALEVHNVQAGPDVHRNIWISAAQPTQNVALFTISCNGCATILQNDIKSTSYGPASFAWYLLGDGVGQQQSVLTSMGSADLATR